MQCLLLAPAYPENSTEFGVKRCGFSIGPIPSQLCDFTLVIEPL